MKKTVIFQVFSLVLFIGCTVTPEPNPEPNPVERSFNWSGFTWRVKNSTNETVGPGKNYFSNSTDNVWIDNGELHLKITKRNGKYYCPEVSTKESVSYGYYNFYISSRVDDLDKNVVVGLFTWNNMNCKTNANSEIDIEFSKWGNSNNSNTLIYSVQPTEGGQYFERTQSFPIQLNGDYSVHSFTWSSNLIEWSSYHGHTIPSPSSNYIASWTYDITNTQNQSRSKSECNSNPIKIPAPESDTKIDLNVWLFDKNQDGYGDPPSDGNEVEVVIHKIEYCPDKQLNLSGIWQGFLTQPGAFNDIFNYTLTLDQTNGKISGTSRSEIPSTPYYVEKKLSGNVNINLFTFSDNSIISQNPSPGYTWYFINGKLNYKEEGDSLIGNWWTEASYFPTGDIKIHRTSKLK